MIAFSQRPGPVQGTVDVTSLDLVGKILADPIFPLYLFVLRSRNPFDTIVVWMTLGKRLEEFVMVMSCDGDLAGTQARQIQNIVPIDDRQVLRCRYRADVHLLQIRARSLEESEDVMRRKTQGLPDATVSFLLK